MGSLIKPIKENIKYPRGLPSVLRFGPSCGLMIKLAGASGFQSKEWDKGLGFGV